VWLAQESHGQDSTGMYMLILLQSIVPSPRQVVLGALVAQNRKNDKKSQFFHKRLSQGLEETLPVHAYICVLI